MYYHHHHRNLLTLSIATAFLLTLTLCLSNSPLPKCQVGFFYKTLPLTAEEGYIINLDKIFTGYNLSYTLSGAQEFLENITMKDKITLQKREVPDQQLIGLKNYHITKSNNIWGNSFIALTDRGDKSYIHFGVLNSNTTAPVINNVVVVENLTNTTCHDAVIFPVKDLVLVDCSVKLVQPSQTGRFLQNIFYYFRLSDGGFLKTLTTEMYINFQSITKRRLEIYSELHSDHTFLLRTYLTDGVDEANSGNTYVDIFMITQPQKPWIVQMIDRSYFKINQLKISDIKIYLGEIYVLDRDRGVFRVRITTQEDLKFIGHYQARGFTRFSVYSNNLDDSFQLALANSNSVYEIDWSEIDRPKLLNKYSLMPDSNVISVSLNNRFVVVHSISQADPQSSNNPLSTSESLFQENEIQYYNYTWIFTRGSRTYTNAFLTLSHNTSETFVDFNEALSYLIVIDTYQLVNYKIDSSNLVLRLSRDQDYLDRMMAFTVQGVSKEKLAPDFSWIMEDNCSIIVNFTLLEDNNRTLWPIGLEPPSEYVANFPGKVVIPLYEYVLGPNITYTIKETSQGEIKKSKVYQNEQLAIQWQTAPPENMTIRHMRTEFHRESMGDVLYIYLQDTENISYINYCLPKDEDIEVYCNQTYTQDLGGQLTNWIPSLLFSTYQLKFFHIVAYTLSSHRNRIYLFDLETQLEFTQVNIGKGYAGQITSIEITGKYMFVVLKYVKTIEVYDLELCLEDLCEPIYLITHLTMYNLGVTYFAPRTVHTSIFHKEVIFIKTVDSIIALDVDKQGRPVLLNTIKPVPGSEIDFSFKMNQNSLIVRILPSTIQQYDISRIYFKEVTITKKYPLYGNKMPKDSAFEVSDYGNVVFVSTVNEADNRLIYVYKTGLPAVASLLNIVNLFVFSPILVDASGSNIDYLTVVSEQEIRIFRQHQIPIAEIESAEKDYEFLLQYTNSASPAKLQTISVEIINLPTNITVAPFLQDIMATKDLLFSGQNRLSEIDDSGWYTGNVLKIFPECRDCENEVKVMNHIKDEGKFEFLPNMYEYKWSKEGGTFQQIDNNIQVHPNGTIRNIVPLSDQQICFTITLKQSSHYQVSGCYDAESINLQLVSTISQEKPFAFESYATKAKNMLKLGSANQLIMLVDTSSNPVFKSTPGGVFIYAIDEDLDSDYSLIELQYFDGYEIGGDSLGFIYIVNAHLSYHSGTDVYRLYLTDITKGVLIIEFIYDKPTKSLTVKHLNFLNIPRILSQQHKKVPYDATYQSIALLSSKYDPNDRQYYQKLLVTTGLYHTLQLELVYDMNGIVKSTILSRIYLRYAFYTIDNQIEVHNDLFVVRQYLPLELDNGTLNRQLLTVYDTRGDFNGTIQDRGMIGAYLSNDTLLHNFDFNLTFNQKDHHQQPRVNMVMVEYGKNIIQQLSLHRNLSVFTAFQVDTQIIYLDLYNDFSLKRIRILLNGIAPFPEWLIVAIVLFSIVGLGILIIIGLMTVRFVKGRRQGSFVIDEDEGKERSSLLTDH